MLEIRLLGKFAIKYNGKPVAIPSRAAQSLFAYLILTAETLHRREKLAGMFWPDVTEEKARAYLRHELWLIRKTLSQKSKFDYLNADDIDISFNASAEYWLDVSVFKNIEESASIEELKNVLSIFQGELLPGFYDDWVTHEREHLQAVYEQKIARLLELLEKERCWNDILEWAEHWISLGHGPEAAYRYLMIAYDAMGDRTKVSSTYERCVQALRELDLEPSEQTRALAFKRTTKLNIPIPLTSFIGREKELKEIAGLFSKSRLITLTGSGGVGKTRLAIQIVADVLDRFPDGVWFLDLAPLSDPALVPNTLANLLGLRESGDIKFTDLLSNYFRSRAALVIFDNCEHLIESCAQLVNLLLISCERLSVLATSREVLRVSGEIPYRVPSLELPALDTKSTIDILKHIESIRLFGERARIVRTEFTIDSQNVLVVAQICQRLDGIPLAIELATARTNVLTTEQILKRLDDRFNLLTSGLRSALPRHQTLHATIEWSHDLLSDKESVLFRRSAVFIGGWALEAAEKVCAGNEITSSDMLELLSRLVNKSLVTVEQSSSGIRYHMLETMRQYATEKLVESRESDALRDKHLEYFLTFAETAAPHLIRSEQIEWLPLLDADYQNLRLAFEWSMQKETAELSMRLCAALMWFWGIRWYVLEGINWVKGALAKPYGNESKNEKVARVRALYTHAKLEWDLDNFGQVLSPAEESLELALEVSDERDIAIATFFVGGGLMFQGEGDDQPRSMLERSFTKFQELNEPFWQAVSFDFLIAVLMRQGKLSYREGWEKYLEFAHAAGERLLLAEALAGYAYWLSSIDRVDEAREQAEEADRLAKELGIEDDSSKLALFAEIAQREGDYQKATSLYIELQKRANLRGEKGGSSTYLMRLGLLAMEEGVLDQAKLYLEQALSLRREAVYKPSLAYCLIEMGNLFYLQGNIESFKQYFKEGLSLKNHLPKLQKVGILRLTLGSLYFQRPENSVRILGVIDHESEFDDPPSRYCERAKAHAQKVLGEALFKSAFADGQKMSLDEGLDLVLKTVEEM